MLKRKPDEDLNRNSHDWSCGDAKDREPGAFTTLRQILFPREWPEAETLGEFELIALLNGIEFDLLQSLIQVDFLDTLPPRVAYRGILQLLDSPLEASRTAFQIQHIDGCDSACESCFQLAHCAVAREVLGKDWRVAVEQAGINPSWSALFSGEDE